MKSARSSVFPPSRLPLLLPPGQRHGGQRRQDQGLRGAKLGNPYLRWAFGERPHRQRDSLFGRAPIAASEAQMGGNKFKSNTVVAIKLVGPSISCSRTKRSLT